MAEEDKEELFDEDEAEYSRKSEYSKASVVQSQVLKCNELRSKEMCEGHSLRIVDNKGNLKIIDIPDSRQPYIGALIALKSNLAPEIRTRDGLKTKEKIKIFETKRKKIFDKYKYKEIVLKQKDGKPQLVYSGKEFIPKKGAILVANIQRSKNSPIKEMKVEGLWDNQINAYWDELIELYDELFETLNILIDKKNYFKEVSGW